MSIIGDIIGAIQHEGDKDFNERQASLNREFQHNEAQLAYERELSADSTKYQRQVLDMAAAGLNPMMAVSAGAGSVHSSPASGSAATAPGPFGFSGPNLGAVISMKQLQIQKDVADAEIEKTRAEAERIRSQKLGQDIANEIAEATKDSQIEAAELANKLTSSNINHIEDARKEIASKIKLLAEQASSESVKRALMSAQESVANASAYKIIKMLPYEQRYMAAKTEESKNAALLSAAHALYQNRLIDDGYIDAFIESAKAGAESAQAKAAIDNIKAAIRTGDYSKTNLQEVPGISQFLSGVANFLDNFNPLSNILK